LYPLKIEFEIFGGTMAKELDSNSFKSEIIEGKATALIDFWAPWCGPCRMLGPIIENLSQKYAGKVTIAKVNVDNSPDLAANYNVASIPTLLFFKNGDLIHTAIGVSPEPELDSLISEKLL